MPETDAPEPERPEEDAPLGPPAPAMETGRIEIIVGMNADGGIQRSWSILGMNGYEALGHLEVLGTLIRMGEAAKWAQGSSDGPG